MSFENSSAAPKRFTKTPENRTSPKREESMRAKRRFATMGLTAVLALTLTGPADAGILIQGWYWDSPIPDQNSEEWWDKLSRMAPQLRKWGVTGIWIPPGCKGGSGKYSSGYDVYDFYDLGSKDSQFTRPTKWGHKHNLLKFVATAHAVGMDVYFDIVPNHRSGGTERGFKYDPPGSEGPGRFPMSPQDFHHNGHGDWDEALAGLPDMAQEVPYVRDQLFAWIRWLDKQTGVDGYRVDAIKHMPPNFIEGLLWQVQDGMNQQRFTVGEYYDGNPGTLQYIVNATQRRCGVFDFTYFFELLSMAHGWGSYDMRGLRNHVYDDEKRVTFANNHDTFRRANGLHLYMRTDLAYAVLMASSGYPSVYWLDLFDENGEARDYLINLMWVNTFLAHGAQLERWADHDLYVMERDSNLLAGFNDAGHWRTEWVRTNFGPNQQLHDYGRHGVGDIWTNNDGYARISVPPGGYVMYGRLGHEGKVPGGGERRTTQEWEAASDMDRRPAGEYWANDPISFTSAKGQPITIDLYLEDPTVVAHVALFDAKGKRLNHARGQGQVSLNYGNPPADGWYQIKVGLEQTGQNKRSDFWCKVNYQGVPYGLGDRPYIPYDDFDVLPLIPSSVGP